MTHSWQSVSRQHAASIYGFVRKSVTFVKKNLWVRSLGYSVGASPPPFENMCVRSLDYIASLHAAYSALRHFSFQLGSSH